MKPIDVWISYTVVLSPIIKLEVDKIGHVNGLKMLVAEDIAKKVKIRVAHRGSVTKLLTW